MQEFVEYIVVNVWCSDKKEFSMSLFDDMPELKDIIKSFADDSRKGIDYLYKPIKDIFQEFKKLRMSDRDKIKNGYYSNNNIEKLCHNVNNIVPLNYDDVKVIDENLSLQLKKFFNDLYDKVLNLAIIKDKIGNIDEHYKLFVNENSKKVCAICGLASFFDSSLKYREAYDHYLPKSIYPFISVNFKNLVPICNKCNSYFKKAKDPLYDSNKNRRKAFYIYDDINPSITIKLHIMKKDLRNLDKDNIKIEIGSLEYKDEVETWNELFQIKDRYVAEYLNKDRISYWLEMIEDELNNYINDIDLEKVFNIAKKYPYNDMNFLKVPFWEEYMRLNHSSKK